MQILKKPDITYNVVTPPNGERHPVSDKIRSRIKRYVRRRVVTVGVPERTFSKSLRIPHVHAHIASVPSPVSDVGKRTCSQGSTPRYNYSSVTEPTMSLEMGNLDRHVCREI